jgi:hypothetical protein
MVILLLGKTSNYFRATKKVYKMAKFKIIYSIDIKIKQLAMYWIQIIR